MEFPSEPGDEFVEVTLGYSEQREVGGRREFRSQEEGPHLGGMYLETGGFRR